MSAEKILEANQKLLRTTPADSGRTLKEDGTVVNLADLMALISAAVELLGGTVTTSSDGSDVGLVESLPNAQVAIVQNNSTVVDLMGLECLAAGDVAVKFTNDLVAFTRTVVAGQIIYGRIVAVMATNTTIADADFIGLK
jgi:hypothetical protein